MNKPLAIVLVVLGWGGVALVSNFSKLVPNASPEEVRPFSVPVWVFAIVATLYAIKAFTAKPPAR